MNHVTLMGRLVADPEVNYAQTEKATCIARYRIAVDRRRKQDGQPEADFLNCVAFGKGGEFARDYLRKGMKIAVEGRIQTGSYEKDGIKLKVLDSVDVPITIVSEGSGDRWQEGQNTANKLDKQSQTAG